MSAEAILVFGELVFLLGSPVFTYELFERTKPFRDACRERFCR